MRSNFRTHKKWKAVFVLKRNSRISLLRGVAGQVGRNLPWKELQAIAYEDRKLFERKAS
jgi:hypothetical protein